MRRFFFAVALSTIAAAGPMQAWGGDREIAEQIIKRLKVQRDAGSLKGFTLDLKVEEGVVLLRGKVSRPDQKQAVLAAAGGLEGVRRVVDEIAVTTAAPTDNAVAAAKPAADTASKSDVKTADAAPIASAKPARIEPQDVQRPADSGFSFRQALAAKAPLAESVQGLIMPDAGLEGRVVPAAASEEAAPADSDQQITSSVVRALADAQKQGRLRGFGVDVTTRGGDVWLAGRAASQQHKALIMELARSTAGVRNVVDDITVYAPEPLSAPPAAPLGTPQQMAASMRHVDVQPVAHPVSSVDMGGAVSAAQPIAGTDPSQVPYPPQPGMPQAYAANYAAAAGVAVGQPMPGCAPGTAGYAGAGYAGAGYAGAGVAGAGIAAPRYDQPYLPNYAWPGYAAYPNYAAVTYPQQYSPSAWPYIGPFYPYPQVPLGWRKVSLEWDDGWWFLDFTDR